MNPMALLTLPVSSLRDAAQHRHQSSPSGERGERRGALWGVVVMLAIGGALMLLR